MSFALWLLAGLLNLAGGLALFVIRWPSVGVQVPADVLFNAVPLIAAVNLVATGYFRRAWRVLLTLNALCGPVLGLFAAFYYQSFTAGLVALLTGSLPSLLALRSGIKNRTHETTSQA